MELLAESLDRDQVAHAVSLVSLAGNYWDSELNSVFGGRTYFSEEPSTAASPVAAGTRAVPRNVAPSLSPGTAPAADRKVEDPPAAGYI